VANATLKALRSLRTAEAMSLKRGKIKEAVRP
jgi:hypothetical protein